MDIKEFPWWVNIYILLGVWVVGFYLYKQMSRTQKSKEQYGPEYVAPPPGVARYTIASELEIKRANKFALKELCKRAGYEWAELSGSEFVYDCKHNKRTCIRDSVPNDPAGYQEWRDLESKDVKEIVELGSTTSLLSSLQDDSTDYKRAQDITSNKDGVCILASLGYKDFCEDEGINYDPSNGKCSVTRPYCNKSLLTYCGEDCMEDPCSMVNSKIFGVTLGRSMCFLNFITLDAMCNGGTPPAL